MKILKIHFALPPRSLLHFSVMVSNKALSVPILRLLVALLLILIQSPVYADGYAHDGGLWGNIKDPIRDKVKENYEGLSDKGKFCVGMGVRKVI